uniref:Uncharacterized protein n=1 Tax=Lymantria dispar multicapsid nuclear polyhedrosis virus TaxID=10449 RepID=A0A1B1MR60_NPVLD|nr:hypothetical protein [Lymantria dispar multiple nucleopolyhedrovirus]
MYKNDDNNGGGSLLLRKIVEYGFGETMKRNKDRSRFFDELQRVLGDVVWCFVQEGFVLNPKLRSVALRSREDQARHVAFVEKHRRAICSEALKRLYRRYYAHEMTIGRVEWRDVEHGLQILTGCQCPLVAGREHSGCLTS